MKRPCKSVLSGYDVACHTRMSHVGDVIAQTTCIFYIILGDCIRTQQADWENSILCEVGFKYSTYRDTNSTPQKYPVPMTYSDPLHDAGNASWLLFRVFETNVAVFRTLTTRHD